MVKVVLFHKTIVFFNFYDPTCIFFCPECLQDTFRIASDTA